MLKLGRVAVPWTYKVEALVVVPIPTEPLALTLNKVMPVEELIWKGFKVVVPWTNNETVADDAFTPPTTLLSINIPLLKVEADVHLAK